MKALVYKGKGVKVLEERPKPEIEHLDDAIIRVTHTTICGTDLHILKGDVPTCEPGRILGHEGVGIVEETGSGVVDFKPGDHVLISCITSCGRCAYCKKQEYSHCTTGGWILGHRIDGTQAEYVRIPHADTSLHHIPEGCSEEAIVMLSDIFPTGYEIGVLNGKMKPGDVVAIVGSGPIGLAVLLTAQFFAYSKLIMIDLDRNRLIVALTLGATNIVNNSDGKAADRVMEITGGRGVDVAVEAVGIPETFELCQDIIAPGGVIANVGVHGRKADFHLERLWSEDITVTTGLVSTNTTPMLLNIVKEKRIDPSRLITHRIKFDDIIMAYDIFSHAEDSRALKVIIEAA